MINEIFSPVTLSQMSSFHNIQSAPRKSLFEELVVARNKGDEKKSKELENLIKEASCGTIDVTDRYVQISFENGDHISG